MLVKEATDGTKLLHEPMLVSEVRWHLSESNFTSSAWIALDAILYNEFWKLYIKKYHILWSGQLMLF